MMTQLTKKDAKTSNTATIVIATFFSISLMACGTSSNFSSNNSNAASSTPASVVTPLPSPSTTLLPPISTSFKINGTAGYGTANDVVAPPVGALSDGAAKVLSSVTTDGRLVVDLTANNAIQIYNDWSGTYANNPYYYTGCIQFTVKLIDKNSNTTQSTQTLTVQTPGGTCPTQTPARATADFSGSISGNGPWNVSVSNFQYMTCNYWGCSFQNPIRSLVASGTIQIHTSSTN